MKSSAVNRIVAPAAPSSPLSHIPLPRRKNSSKGDKEVEDTDSEYSQDAVLTRSQARMSLLGSTTFCCASGQKESDYIVPPDPRRKRPPAAPPRKEPDSEPSTPTSPFLAARGLLAKARKGKPSQEKADGTQSISSDGSGARLSQDEIRTRSVNLPQSDSKLRLLDEKRKITPPSPQRLLQRNTARKDTPDLPRKSSETTAAAVLRKHQRKDSVASLNADTNKQKCNPSSSPVLPIVERRVKCDSCDDVTMDDVLWTSNRSPSGSGRGDVTAKSREDFDCPCCDKMDECGLSDLEVKMLASRELSEKECRRNFHEACNIKEQSLQVEVQSLQENLQAERLKLQDERCRVRCLEDDLSGIQQQLREELDKEKELRKIAEDKLLELLNHEEKMEQQRKEKEKQMESKGTQLDPIDPLQEPSISEPGSPLLLGYDGRLRKYQTYIAKLEKDNLMLVNELKKFKDLSPRSQEEQAKCLVEKLGQMERNNHQQQMQYETCLDEVANKLVQTLLVQKRLEEECKILHLRVEQLEQENGTLLELINPNEEEKVAKCDIAKSSPSTNSYNVQHRKPSCHPLTSSPIKKSPLSPKPFISSEEQKESPKSTNNALSAKSDPTSPITSPSSSSSKLGCASKIPSFGNSKPVLNRKKSEMDMQPPRKHKNDGLSREASASELVPNSKTTSGVRSPRTKLPNTSKGTKGISAKRKRLSRNDSPADKDAKDSKQRMKSGHARWDAKKMASPDTATPSRRGKDCANEIPVIPTFPQPQQVWSFNCQVNPDVQMPDIGRKVSTSIDILGEKLNGICLNEGHLEDIGKQNTSESSAMADGGGNRTRDEGYSTMSSDLQPDSAADTTISEPETYVVREKDIHCGSEDSVTECMDGSMCSSSDSGIEPLYQVSTLKFSREFAGEEEPMRADHELPKFEIPSKKNGTVRSKEQIASVKPTIRNPIPSDMPRHVSEFDSSKSGATRDNFAPDPTKLENSSSDNNALPFKTPQTLGDPLLKDKLSHVDQCTLIDYWDFPKDLVGLTNYRNSWHLGPTKSIYEDKIVFCTRNSYIEDNIFDEKVETAEKATLTEPEEESWREKALAPFIDESIWSLYSSEGDIQVKHFPIEPVLSEPSLEKLITSCSPCIVITENIESRPQSDAKKEEIASPIVAKSSNSSAHLSHVAGHDQERFRPGLERVASDTVLYLKDAVNELEDSMRKGLKSSKNVAALHQNSGSESESSPISFKPEILRTLETTMNGQENLQWPSPSRSSSTSSLQSYASGHVSDEMEDVEIIRTSRKGSRDNDLNSASDVEYENLEHKDFVERWLQKEITFNNPKVMAPFLEPVSEIGEFAPPSVRRKTSLPDAVSSQISPPPRNRFRSFPNESSIPLFPLSPARTNKISRLPSRANPPDDFVGNDKPVENPSKSPDYLDDTEIECLVDAEAKEFNEDFYTLCSIGSLKSLDRFSPAKTIDPVLKQMLESPVFRKRTPSQSLSKADKPKPTGLVKPTRPISLAVPSVPKVPGHVMLQKTVDVVRLASSSGAISKIPPPDRYPESNSFFKVPPNNFSVSDVVPASNPCPESMSEVCRPSVDRSVVSSLPDFANCAKENTVEVSVKPKVPSRIVIRSGSPSKMERQQLKRDRLAARRNRLKEGCGTAWVHLQPTPALSDPTMRSSLLESMKAPTSSSGSSGTEEEDNEVLVIHTNSHLHRICKERRHRAKASANNPMYDLRKRSTIVNRSDLFYRFGDKEKEAIACFDFLEELPIAAEMLAKQSISDPFQPIPPSHLSLSSRQTSSKERVSLLSPVAGDAAIGDRQESKMADLAKCPFTAYSARKLRLPNLWNKPLSHNMSSSTLNSQDCELLDHLSLSDSCAESYSSTPESYDDAS